MASTTRESLAIDVAPLLARPPAPTLMLRRTVAAAGLGALVVVLADQLASSHTALTYSAPPSAATLAGRPVASQQAPHGTIGRAPRLAAGPESLRLAADAGRRGTAAPDASPWLSPVPVCALAAGLAAVAFALIRPIAPSLAPSAWAMCAIEEEENDPTYVLVTNLPDKATSGALLQHFAASGEVVNAFIEIVREGSTPTRRGVVQFSTWEGAALAVQTAKERPLSGVVLQVDPDLRPASVHATKAPKSTRPSGGEWKRSPKDRSANGSREDVARAREIQGMVEKWVALRSARSFKEADAINDTLVKMGVRLNKIDNTWTISSAPGAETGPLTSVIVTNLPASATQATLVDHFGSAAPVLFVALFKDPQTGAPNGGAAVRFETEEGAKQAFDALKDKPVDGARVTLRLASSPPEKFAGKPRAGPPTFAAWSRDPTDSSAADEALVAEVTAVLQERDAAKKAREFAKADGLKDSLQAKGVFVSDVTRQWSQSPIATRPAPRAKAAPTFKDWTRDPEDRSVVDEALAAEVMALLQERDNARKLREWTKSDEFQDRLLEKGVIFDDKSRTWRRAVISEAESQTVEILNLPPTITWDDLRSHFGKAGKVEFIYIASDPTTGIPRGPGTVRFSTPEEAQKAIAWLPQNPVRGSTLIARLSTKVQVPRRVSKPRAKAAPKPAASKA